MSVPSALDLRPGSRNPDGMPLGVLPPKSAVSYMQCAIPNKKPTHRSVPNADIGPCQTKTVEKG
jgi:hypothetical protein